MRYKGYEAIVDFDEADGVLHGRTLGTRDVISFEADSAHEIERAFHEAIDDYIEQSEETGPEPVPPPKPKSNPARPPARTGRKPSGSRLPRRTPCWRSCPGAGRPCRRSDSSSSGIGAR